MNIYEYFKPILFSFNPEIVHDASLHLMSLAPNLSPLFGGIPDDRLQIKIGNTKWKTPVGLAAGFDKNAQAISFLSSLGFGQLEIGTVTLLPQYGNKRPRIWRHQDLQSIRNALGFPSKGASYVLKQLTSNTSRVPLSLNIGKNKDSSPAEALLEYVELFSLFAPLVTQITINISSPNTPGLRDLNFSWAQDLFQELRPLRDSYPVDLFLKISPDQTLQEVDGWLECALRNNLNGIIATNTTTQHSFDRGGMSGKFLQSKSQVIYEHLLSKVSTLKNFEIICVGGIESTADLLRVWEKGGKAIQLYTSFVYQGPSLLKKINQDILQLIKTAHVSNLEEFFLLDQNEKNKIFDYFRTIS